MISNNKSFIKGIVLASSLNLFIAVGCYAALPINTVNEGQIIQGGTYGNTSNGVTIFKNSTGGGLWLPSASTVRGIEVNSNGTPDNNGGTISLYAPGSVIRVDGTINVNGLANGTGAYYIGNGGKVLFNSAYLFQNGNIYANGVNGGLVEMNVGSMTLGPTATISAQGFGGQGGVVSVNASGPVDLQKGSVIDTSGKVDLAFDTNVINIEGGLVNVEGTIQANGVNDRGGTIRLVATGQSDLSQTQQAIQQGVSSGVLSSTDAATINTRMSSLKASSDGDIIVAPATSTAPAAYIFAIGTGSATTPNNDPADSTVRAGDGGTVLMTAENNINNSGIILAYGSNGNTNGGTNNGGNGGTINLNAGSAISNTNQINAIGGQGNSGGYSGLISFNSLNGLSNTGTIKAQGGAGSAGNGGNGGLIDFVTTTNPSGNGSMSVAGGIGSQGFANGQAGNMLVPNTSISQTNQIQGNIGASSEVEMLGNAENLLLLTGNNPSTSVGDLRDFGASAIARTVFNQTGEVLGNSGPAFTEISNKLALSGGTTPTYLIRNVNYANSGKSGNFYIDPIHILGTTQNDSVPFNNFTILAIGNLAILDDEQPSFTLGNQPMGGAHLSAIVGSLNNDATQTNGLLNGGLSGGSIDLTATSGGIGGIAISQIGSLSGGSQILKAVTSIGSNIGEGLGPTGSMSLVGGTQQLFAQSGAITSFLK